jgi:putative hemolysin
VTAAELTTADIWMIVAIVVLLFILAFLAVAETALNRISRVKAIAMAEQHPSKAAAALARLVAHPERFINPLLVTVTIVQTGQAFLTSLVASRLFGAAGVAVGFVINVVIFFVMTEAMPKTFAIMHAERAALMTSRFTEWLVSFPLLRLLSRGLIGLTNVLLPGKGLKEGPFVSESELLGIVEAAAEDEVIEHEERRLIESIIEFGDTVAREVMVPRPDMKLLLDTMTVTKALDEAIEYGISRVPVMSSSDSGEVLGLAYTKDLMRAEREGGGANPVTDLLRRVRFIPENKPVARLMREMQAEKFHLALVVDEYGEVAGLVTLEDCLEELVGDIVDEFDSEVEAVQRLDDGSLLVAGHLTIGDLDDLLDSQLPDDEWDTVAGLLFGTLGHVPVVGESVVEQGWRFTAAEMEGRRITRVSVAAESDVTPGEPTRP